MFICPRCCTAKPPEAFALARGRKNGRQGYCKLCNKVIRKLWYDKHHAEQRARTKAWAEEHPERMKELRSKWHYSNQEHVRMTKLFSKYRITKSMFMDILAKQNNSCAGCQTPLGFDRHSHVDHCHQSKKVRGILCRACNTALGLVKDSTQVLNNLSAYLKSSGGSK